MSDELLTISQTASYLKLSAKTIRRLIKNQQIIASKVSDRAWRIKVSDIDEYFKSHTNGKQRSQSK